MYEALTAPKYVDVLELYNKAAQAVAVTRLGLIKLVFISAKNQLEVNVAYVFSAFAGKQDSLWLRTKITRKYSIYY